MKCAETMIETEGMANQWLAQIETHPCAITRPETINDTLLCLQPGSYYNHLLSDYHPMQIEADSLPNIR